MDRIFAALADPVIRGLYLAICFVAMVLPMLALAWWYHARIRKTPGGRALMERQNQIGARSLNLFKVARMGSDLEAGRYGVPARQMQHRAYAMTGVWLVVLVAMFGLLIWADEVNRATP